MTGREKIEAAFSAQGSREVPVVICYEGIFIRDHWCQITDAPWWHQNVPDIELQMTWRRQLIRKTDLDWCHLPAIAPRTVRRSGRIEERESGVFRVDAETGREERLLKPTVGGWVQDGAVASAHPEPLADTPEKIDSAIPIDRDYNPRSIVADGRADLARVFLKEFAGQVFPISSVSSPSWGCYGLWGFEGMMTMVADHPELVRHACSRLLELRRREIRDAAAIGAAAIWIEECMTDMISPDAFAELVLPYVRAVVDDIRAASMKSIYYYCGNPAGKWRHLLGSGADALSLEEGKKGFDIDIEEVVERVKGRMAVLGNLDAMRVLERAPERELRSEIARQIAAGRRNGSRFIMSIGSPVTPGTPIERVKRYGELTRELGVG